MELSPDTNAARNSRTEEPLVRGLEGPIKIEPGEMAGDFLHRMLETRHEWTERIALNADGSFAGAGKGNFEMNHIAIAQREYTMKLNAEGLYEMAKIITDRHPELVFSFARDPKGRYIEYSVKKSA
jgi:hypothetical protein